MKPNFSQISCAILILVNFKIANAASRNPLSSACNPSATLQSTLFIYPVQAKPDATDYLKREFLAAKHATPSNIYTLSAELAVRAIGAISEIDTEIGAIVSRSDQNKQAAIGQAAIATCLLLKYPSLFVTLDPEDCLPTGATHFAKDVTFLAQALTSKLQASSTAMEAIASMRKISPAINRALELSQGISELECLKTERAIVTTALASGALAMQHEQAEQKKLWDIPLTPTSRRLVFESCDELK